MSLTKVLIRYIVYTAKYALNKALTLVNTPLCSIVATCMHVRKTNLNIFCKSFTFSPIK